MGPSSFQSQVVALDLGLNRRQQPPSANGTCVQEFVETESGKSHKNRPALLAALEACRKHRATLLIARLDRLARNVAFIASLMESGVEFVAVDMPHASKFTIHILAAVAEHEREIISKRTKAAC